MKILPFIITSILLVFSIQAKAMADTLTIQLKPTENNYLSIQNALSAKTDKPLKIILDGVFKIDRTLTTEKDHTSIDFTKNSKILFTTNDNTGIIFKNNNCVLKNGKIEGTGKSASNFYVGYGILIYGSDNNKVLNTTFTKMSGAAIFMMYRTKGCDHNLISGNKIRDSAFYLGEKGDEAAIFLGYSGDNYFHNNNIVENNEIDGNNILKIGIGLIGHGQHNTFRNNNIKNCLNYGIVAYESIYTDLSLSGTQILNNFVENIGEIGNRTTKKGMGIYLLKSKDSKISGNTVKNAMKNSDRSETLGSGGISVIISPNTLVENNIVDGSAMYGIQSDYSFGSVFKNNKVSNTGRSGAYFINMNDVLIDGNTFRNCAAPVIKGYFQYTSFRNIGDQLNTNQYKNISTGSNFIMINNSIYTDQVAVSFQGIENDTSKNVIGNRIKNNVFKDNKIIGSTTDLSKIILFQNEITGSNKILNNLLRR